jgi:hypothetical protein
MNGFTHAYCAMCEKHDYVGPLHGERGGPLCCLPCIGKWDAEHNPRRRARRTLIKALKAYEATGGSLYDRDFDRLKLAAAGIFGRAARADDDFNDLTSELLTATIALTHPDKHPPERKAEAQRVTQELLALKPFVFPAPEPEPEPNPRDVSSKNNSDVFNNPSPADYPCEDCRDTISDHYCDACKAQWEEEQAEKRKREEQKRKKKNARQRKGYQVYKRLRCSTQPTICASCGNAFKPKRSDTQYCSAACRQRAYVKRDGKPSNAKPLNRQEIERAIRDAFTSNPDNAFTTDDLCKRVYLGLKQAERKHRAAVIPIAKRVCEQLGENWDWWRSEQRGGALVFWNRISVTSYAMARLKSDFLNGYGYRRETRWCWSPSTEEDLKAEISPGGRHHEYVVEGGAWWQHCQEDIAKFKAATANQNSAGDDLTSRQRTAA